MTIADREPKAEILTSFIKQFYAGTPYVPRELMIRAGNRRPGGAGGMAV